MVGMFWRRRSRPACGVRRANRKGEHTGLVNVTEDDFPDYLVLRSEIGMPAGNAVENQSKSKQ